MNVRRAMLVVLAIAGAFAPGFLACESTPPRSKAQEAVDTGRAAWAALKSTCEAYNYDRAEFFQVSPAITSVQIVDDAPAWRSYAQPDRRDAGLGPAEAWVEEGTGIGSHAQGFRALTVEQLYDDCEAALTAALRDDFQLTVDQGAPTSCGWPDGGCLGDACDRQVNLIGFSCSQLPPAHVAIADAGTSTAP
jgi:hypothetical protein